VTGAVGDHAAPARPPFLAICDYAEPGCRFPRLHMLHTVRVHLAKPIGNQLARIDDIKAIQHLFTWSGWPR
jgi:hypothetical protein